MVAAAYRPFCASGEDRLPVPLKRALHLAPASALCAILSVLAPSDCRLCGLPLVESQRFPVCSTCIEAIARQPLGSCCSLCAEPLPPDASVAYLSPERAALCTGCRAEAPPCERAVAFGLYGGLREAIRLLKFDGVRSLDRPLGDLLALAMLQLREGAPSELAVVPVPLFRGKRDFNQSTLLARRAIRTLRKSAPEWRLTLSDHLLRRVRSTESQFLLSPAQRRKNLRRAFHASSAVRGRHVLLVDDVYTTGATARECTRVLLRAGACSVRVATLARAGRDTAELWQPVARLSGHEMRTQPLLPQALSP